MSSAETWDAGTSWDQGTTWDSVYGQPYHSVPAGRGRWRLVLAWRRFAPQTAGVSNVIAELIGARSRTLTQALDAPAQLTFTISGRNPVAAEIAELAQEVWAYRWNHTTGIDDLMFIGVITNAEDQLTDTGHTINVTCQDSAALLKRRATIAAYTGNDMEQDWIVGDLINFAGGPGLTGIGTGLATPLNNQYPAAFLPIGPLLRNPDSTNRANPSGVMRQRNYAVGQSIYDALDSLHSAANGFDWDVQPNGPGGAGLDVLRVFYPSQGVDRPDFPLVFGWNVAGVTRTVNSSDYANYEQYLGQSTDGTSPPPVAVALDPTTSADVRQGAAGMWMNTASAADVSVQSTLQEQANGALAVDGVLVPSYTLTLRAGAWEKLAPPSGPFSTDPGIHMGDVVPLVVKSGRLDVETGIRVVGIAYDVGDDGGETVEITVGRPDATLTDFYTGANRRLSALERR